MERVMAIRGILFDKDGTLIEVNGTWVPLYKSMLASEFGHSADEIAVLLARGGYDAATDGFKAGSVMAGGTTREIADLWWPELSAEDRRARVYFIDNDIGPKAKSFVKPLLNLAPVFDELKTMGLVLGVGTNDSEASGRAHMAHLDIGHYFDVVIGSDSVAIAKPSGHMIARFAEVTGLAPHEIAMVGDNSHDMEEARAGGAGLAIAVLSGNSGHEHIAHLADETLPSVADIPKLLKRLTGANTTFG
jgi:phosphoglycolate phosphatase